MCCVELNGSVFEAEGFHGTSALKVQEILNSGFEIVADQTLLLGDGAYFFIKGLSDPYQDALDFATNVKKEKSPVVLKADISAEADSVLDLSSLKGAALFNKFKERFFKKRVENNEKMGKDVDDGKIINCLVGEMGFKTKVVLSMRSVKLKKPWIDLNIHSLIPNCVFCCVKDKSCISNVQLISSGG